MRIYLALSLLLSLFPCVSNAQETTCQFDLRDHHYSAEGRPWILGLPDAPQDAVAEAEEQLRELAGAEDAVNHFEVRSARQYPPGELFRDAVYLVCFRQLIEGPDYSLFLPVGVMLDAENRVVDTRGIADCRREDTACPPFRLARDSSIEIARNAGVRPGKHPTVCEGDFVHGYCLQLTYDALRDRYVWEAKNLTWRSLGYYFAAYFHLGGSYQEKGRLAVIDAQDGRLYDVKEWHAYFD